MPVSRRLTAVLLLGALATPALAADRPPDHACLTKAEQRAALSAHQAIPLAQAIKSVRAHRNRRADIVGAKLCRRGDNLVYVLTLLRHSGKVRRVTVDAANGEVINGR